MTQHELEARYAGAVSAKAACFVYADCLGDAAARLGLAGERDRLVDCVGGAGLRVLDLRVCACHVHAGDASGALLADITVPSHVGIAAFSCGADICLEALDRVAAGQLTRKVVAVSAREELPCAGDVLDACDLAAIEDGLATFPERMQVHVDHARALAEYLSCCECLASVSYPGLPGHPDHEIAAAVLRHGFGPAVDFELDPALGISAGAFIDACQMNGRAYPAGGAHTRLSARDGREGYAVRIFAGLDDPLTIAADLDTVLRRYTAR